MAANFDLLLRLMDDDRYRANLFADISAMTQWNRIGKPLTTVIRRADLHPRLMNGSDYPLPAVNVVISTRALMRAGYITADERAALNEIYHYNPLLFDFVLKRTMRAPGTGERLPASVFMAHAAVGV
jgi:mannonate dehydratase